MAKNLNHKELNFCNFVAGNEAPSRAYSRAFKKTSKAYCQTGARKLLNRDEIQKKIKEIRFEVIQKMDINIMEFLHHCYQMINADVNEIIQYRRVPCRYCYGRDHNYQWVNELEFEMTKLKTPAADFSDAGGFGYNKQLPPFDNCPQCSGEGRGETHVNDTRYLSEGAKHLYNGVKFKKDGAFEVVLRDKDKALAELLKFCYMTGKTEANNNNSEIKIPNLDGISPTEAAQIHQRFIINGNVNC